MPIKVEKHQNTIDGVDQPIKLFVSIGSWSGWLSRAEGLDLKNVLDRALE